MDCLLGIDPGSRVTGYGVIQSDGYQSLHVASGCIRVEGETLGDRLGVIFREVHAIVEQYRPVEMAIERVFVARNPDSALKLGQARGAAVCAAVISTLAVAEYSAREVKRAVVGTGGANKEQVQHMVRHLLGLRDAIQTDAADALAVALCHAHTRSTVGRLSAKPAGRYR